MGLFSWFKGTAKKINDSAFGSDPQIITKSVMDVAKEKVATPLSNYLAGEVGKGVPRYDGKLTEPINSYADYLGQAGDYYDKYIAAPATEQYKRDFQPLIDEGYAGSLRGSGRFGASEDAANRFSESLAQQKAVFAPGEAKNIWEMKSYNLAKEYDDWWKSLPQNNPAIGQALSFLNNSTSTGVDVLSALDPGKQGWFGDVLKGAVTAAVGSCWVASSIFGGWEKKETCNARYYINNIAPKWFCAFYLKYGQRIATFIDKYVIFKTILKPLFVYFSNEGARYLALKEGNGGNQ